MSCRSRSNLGARHDFRVEHWHVFSSSGSQSRQAGPQTVGLSRRLTRLDPRVSQTLFVTGGLPRAWANVGMGDGLFSLRSYVKIRGAESAPVLAGILVENLDVSASLGNPEDGKCFTGQRVS